MFGHSAAYFAVRIVNGLLAVLALFVLTRLMDAKSYGLYALGLSAINIGASIGFQWLVVAAARLYPAHAGQPGLLLATVRKLFGQLALVAAGLAALVALGLAATPVSGRPSTLFVVLVWLGAVAMAWHNLQLQMVNAQGLPARYGKLTATRAASTLLLAVLILVLGGSAQTALAATAAGCVLAAGCFGARFPKVGTLADLPLAPAAADGPATRRQLLQYGLPLSLTYIAVMVVDQSDRFFIAAWSGTAAVAGYAASYDLAQQTVGALLNVFFLAHYPRVTAAWEAGGATAARAAMRPLARGILLTAPVVCGLFMGLAPEICGTMFGPALRTEATVVMPWIAAAVTLGSLRAFFFDIAFHVEKNSAMQLKLMLAMAAVNVALNLLLIPRMGAQGAAIATTVALALGTVASAWFGRRAAICPPVGTDLAKALLLTCAFAVALRWTSNWQDLFLGSLWRCMACALLFALMAWALDLAQTRVLCAAVWGRFKRQR